MTDRLRDNTDIGFVMVPNTVIDESEAFDDAAEKLIYIVLKRHANLRGENAFPSMATISKKIPCSESTVKRKIKSLVVKGLITKENRINLDTGAKTSNMYTIEDFNYWLAENHGSQRTKGSVTENQGVGSQRTKGSVTETDKEYSFKKTSFKKNPLKVSTVTNELENNENDSEHEKSNSEETTHDQDFKTAYDLYMKCGWGIASTFVIEILEQDIKDYGVEIVCHAMKIAALQNARGYKYTESIYRTWEKHNLKTLAAVIEFEEAQKLKREANLKRKHDKPGKGRSNYANNPKSKQQVGSNSKGAENDGYWDL